MPLQRNGGRRVLFAFVPHWPGVAAPIVSRPTMLTPFKRTFVLGLASVLFVAAIVSAVFALRPRIRILDNRFQVVSVAATRGTNQAIYIDSQLRGRVREKLSRLGLGIKPATKGTFGVTDNRNMWIAVVYNGNFPTQDLTGIEAELANSVGKVVRLYQGVREPDPVSKNYIGAWLVDFTSKRFQSATKTSYNLRLKLPNGGGQVAEIHLGTLQP